MQKVIQYSHFLVLYVLAEHEHITQKQVSGRIHPFKQTVNVIILSKEKDILP